MRAWSTARFSIPLPDGHRFPVQKYALDRSAPDLVFYLAGADPCAEDRFGRLGLTRAGLRPRDRLVFEACRRRGLPVVMTLSGGYARDVGEVAEIHADTLSELIACCG